MDRMTELTHLTTPDGVAPGNGYSHVVTGPGRLVVVSGQIALDEHGEVVGTGDITAQARQVFENLGRCLTAAGAGFADLVKLGIFVTDITELPAIRPVRDAFVDMDNPPASTAVQVGALIRPELKLEIEALAVTRD
jgi:enamine deaminase RidA (YjgF/YER057c/UK114 family)